MSPDHPHEHSHDHHHSHHHVRSQKNIRLAFFLNLFFSVIELVGGIAFGSLAITANAVHDFGDALSLGAAWILEKFANRKSDGNFHFGYRRFSLLSALISGSVITTGSILILVKAFSEIGDNRSPNSAAMIGFAVLGLAINGLAARKLMHGETQNEKVLSWHFVEDLLGWLAVLLGAVAVKLTGAGWIDPLLAILLSLFIAWNVIRRLKETIYLFLQGRPHNFSEERFVSEALLVPGVEKVDHLAVWSLDGEASVLSARLHVHQVSDPEKIEALKTAVRAAALKQNARATLETCLASTAHHHD